MGMLRAWSIVVVAVAGCAARGMMVVPDSDWRKVPAGERDAIDRENADELARAQADVRAADAAVAAARARIGAPTAAHKPLVGDDVTVKTDARARADAATIAWRQAELQWRTMRVEVARARLTVVATERELARARAVDRAIDDDDGYAVGLYRGQLARAQQTWYAASARANGGRAQVNRASVEVASQKEVFAQRVRAEGEQLAKAERELQLSRWSTAPVDTMHRRGTKLVSTSAPLALHGKGLGHRGPLVPHLAAAH